MTERLSKAERGEVKVEWALKGHVPAKMGQVFDDLDALEQERDTLRWIELYQAEQDKREEAEKQRDALRAAAIKATGSPHLLCVHPAKVKGCDCLGVMFAKALCDVGRSDE